MLVKTESFTPSNELLCHFVWLHGLKKRNVFAWNLLSNKNFVKQFTVTKFTVDQIEKSKISTETFCPLKNSKPFSKPFSKAVCFSKNVSFTVKSTYTDARDAKT